MKTTSIDHVVCTNCFEYQNKNKKQFVYTTCSELVVFMYSIGRSMNNLLSYCGLVDVRIDPSDKDLPVQLITMDVSALRDGSSGDGKVNFEEFLTMQTKR